MTILSKDNEKWQILSKKIRKNIKVHQNTPPPQKKRWISSKDSQKKGAILLKDCREKANFDKKSGK